MSWQPGWYADPERGDGLRYWDGEKWTDSRDSESMQAATDDQSFGRGDESPPTEPDETDEKWAKWQQDPNAESHARRVMSAWSDATSGWSARKLAVVGWAFAVSAGALFFLILPRPMTPTAWLWVGFAVAWTVGVLAWRAWLALNRPRQSRHLLRPDVPMGVGLPGDGRPVAEGVIFTDAAGRRLTLQDLDDVSGSVNWEIQTSGPVPARAAALHQQARAAGGKGDYTLALSLLDWAQALAPDWTYPVYDAAFTQLLQGDAAAAEQLYAKVDHLAPRGFFTCKTTLDCLRRELAGELPPGFSQAYVTLEWADAVHKKSALESITAQYPSFAPAWSELAMMAGDDDGRLHAVEQGLNAHPDAETRGSLLINKAIILARRGDRDAAIALLGGVALSPESTLGSEHKAKATLALMFRD